MTRASGTKTSSQEVEIKEDSTVAGTAKVTASFSFDGKYTAKVTFYGYSEESWSTSKADYQDHMLAHAVSTLKVKRVQ